MENNQHFSEFINELALQTKMENIWLNTCGTWENCNEYTIRKFLNQCLDYNLDPQFCMSWIEQHMDQIPDWTAVSQTSLNWVHEHTFFGADLSLDDFS